MKPTLVIGASTNPDRYSFKAIKQLRHHGHPVIAFGLRSGRVEDVDIETTWNPEWKVDTVTLYINPGLQHALYEKIILLQPKRVIFNPGTENVDFLELLNKNGIGHEFACTLVLLSIGDY